MRLKHIEVLHAIMVSGSLSGAARLLNVSQPAVTQSLQHAEVQLGYPLFKRVRNRLIPTQETLALYSEVDKLFAQLESVRTLARNLKESAEFELRMLIPPSLSSHVLPLALKRFRRKYKSLALDIRTLHSRDIISAIALREADVGVVYGTHPHPAVEEQLLATGHLVCLMPGSAKQGAGKGRTTLPLTDLAGQPVIRIHHQDPIGFVLNDLAARLGVEFGAGVTVQTYQAALSLAEHGFGPAIVDQFTVAGRRFQGLSALRIEPLVPIQLNAIRPRLETQMAAAGHFIECVKHVAARIVAGDDPAGP